MPDMFICPVCGEHDYTPSTITLQANYGSIHDGERVTIKLCGGCFDKLLSAVNVFSVAMSGNSLTTLLSKR